ncbi:MAG: cytochrome C [Deltaproteobacteria bacterium]|nr:cytochrome C [Deltaproteobacteria bacterium]
MERFTLALIGSIALLICFTTGVSAAPPIVIDDCIKCHDQIVDQVSTRGGLHASEITCQDCHLEHPPKGTNAIPACSMCHAVDDKAHYAIENCQSCHNPHSPLEIDLGNTEVVKPVCVTCHDNEGTQLVEYQSMHSGLDCNECHLEHGQFLACMECHEPHTEEMVYNDCLTCHKPHMPTVVKYPETIPSSFCSGCHTTETEVLMANQTLHHDLTCAYCHKTQHKMIPQCTTCHGAPHDRDLHSKFPNCLDCHIDPHGLEK